MKENVILNITFSGIKHLFNVYVLNLIILPIIRKNNYKQTFITCIALPTLSHDRGFL